MSPLIKTPHFQIPALHKSATRSILRLKMHVFWSFETSHRLFKDGGNFRKQRLQLLCACTQTRVCVNTDFVQRTMGVAVWPT